MKLKIGWAALLLLLAATEPGYGQKVYKQGDAIVMDCGPDSGFPRGAVETSKGQKIAAGTPSDTGAAMANNESDGLINATVYQKLEIAPKDLPTLMTWATAYLSCQKLGEGWRLPTQRELMLIYLFRDAVVGLGGDAFVAGQYVSATQNQTAWCWYVDFITGKVSDGFLRTGSVARTRCVREM